jgi:DNA-binding GntR family transcriptional regulator
VQLGELADINTAFAAVTIATERIALDRSWHETLVAHCPNQRLNQILSGLRTVICRYEILFMSDAGLVTESVQQHRQITGALQANDVEGAKRILTENWRVSLELLLIRLG